MPNLLEETLKILEDHSKTPEDVEWVGSEKYRMTWDRFEGLAEFDYNAGFGSQEVAGDLMVVGSDWWLERGEYDGSEWWEFKTLPAMPGEEFSGDSLQPDTWGCVLGESWPVDASEK